MIALQPQLKNDLCHSLQCLFLQTVSIPTQKIILAPFTQAHKSLQIVIELLEVLSDITTLICSKYVVLLQIGEHDKVFLCHEVCNIGLVLVHQPLLQECIHLSEQLLITIGFYLDYLLEGAEDSTQIEMLLGKVVL